MSYGLFFFLVIKQWITLINMIKVKHARNPKRKWRPCWPQRPTLHDMTAQIDYFIKFYAFGWPLSVDTLIESHVEPVIYESRVTAEGNSNGAEQLIPYKQLWKTDLYSINSLNHHSDRYFSNIKTGDKSITST